MLVQGVETCPNLYELTTKNVEFFAPNMCTLIFLCQICENIYITPKDERPSCFRACVTRSCPASSRRWEIAEHRVVATPVSPVASSPFPSSFSADGQRIDPCPFPPHLLHKVAVQFIIKNYLVVHRSNGPAIPGGLVSPR